MYITYYKYLIYITLYIYIYIHKAHTLNACATARARVRSTHIDKIGQATRRPGSLPVWVHSCVMKDAELCLMASSWRQSTRRPGRLLMWVSYPVYPYLLPNYVDIIG